MATTTDHICHRCHHQREAAALCDAEEMGQGVTVGCELFDEVEATTEET